MHARQLPDHSVMNCLPGESQFQGHQHWTVAKQRTCVRARVLATAPWNASQASPAPSSSRSASSAGVPNAQRTTALARTWRQHAMMSTLSNWAHEARL